MRFLKSIFATAPLRRVAAAIALGILPGLAAAQACPDYTAPQAQNLSYDAAQLSQPQSMPMVAGGNVDLGNCPNHPGYGYVMTGPDFELALNGVPSGSSLVLRSQGTCDTMILANDFTGEWHYNDDGSSGVDPELVIPASDGVFDIWVGTYEAATCNTTFSLQLVQGDVTGGVAGGACPDWALNGAPLNFAAADLATQQRIDVVAGGSIDLSACSANSGAGHVAAAPDFELYLEGAAPGAMLTIGVEGQCDTVLLINDYTAEWQFNDDTNDFNPALTVPAVDGLYDIWAGTWNTDLCQAQLTLQISGMGTTGTLPVKPGAATTPEAPAQTTVQALPDPGNLAGYRDQVGQVMTFAVTGTTSGSVWGTGIYTDDTTLAAAAVHAGVLQAGQSGNVTVQILGPQTSFSGTAANGVTSSNYGAWGGSYSFVQ